MGDSGQSNDDLWRIQTAIKMETVKLRMDSIDATISPDVLCLVVQSRDKGASSLLNAMPLKDEGLALNKQELRDSLRMTFNLPLHDLSSFCACGDRLSINHALTCKRGVSWRQGMMESAICSFRYLQKLETEPHLLQLVNERFNLRSANTSPEARLDMKADGFGYVELQHLLM